MPFLPWGLDQIAVPSSRKLQITFGGFLRLLLETVKYVERDPSQVTSFPTLGKYTSTIPGG